MVLQSFIPLLPPEGLVVITGSTGWVGRTAVHELQRLLPLTTFASRVRLFASRAGFLTVNGIEHRIYPLKALPQLARAEPLAAVLHSAFLTRDRLQDVGFEAYVFTNRWITQQLVDALTLAPAARMVLISSGAAATVPSCDPSQLERDPYGVLKLEEEQRLAAMVPTLVMRLYALSGRFIRDPNRFALGDFLQTALRGDPICIHATMPVFRSYGFCEDITALAWHWLLTNSPGDEGSFSVNPSEPLAAVSCTLDLLRLAQRITELYELPPVQASINPDAVPDTYVADPAPFLDALQSMGLKPTNVDQQLRDTAAGLMKQLDGSLVR